MFSLSAESTSSTAVKLDAMNETKHASLPCRSSKGGRASAVRHTGARAPDSVRRCCGRWAFCGSNGGARGGARRTA
eukprot:885332-Prymnesium_polylepis.1